METSQPDVRPRARAAARRGIPRVGSSTILQCLLLCTSLLGLLAGCANGHAPRYRYVPWVARLVPEAGHGPQEPGMQRPDLPPPRQPQLCKKEPACRTVLPRIMPVLPTEPRQSYDYERAIDEQEQAYRQLRRAQEMEQERRERQWEEEDRQRRNDPRLER